MSKPLTVVAQGAKFVLSNKPFSPTGGSTPGKAQFKSNEFIYCRVEFSQPLEQVFKLPAKDINADYPANMLCYMIEVTGPNGESIGTYNQWVNMPISDNQRKENFLNLDVLAAPDLATTMTCMMPTMLERRVAAGPLYEMLSQSNAWFSQGNGKYKLTLCLKRWTFDDKYQGVVIINPEENWITQKSGEFTFEFNSGDLSTIMENRQKSEALVKENTKKKILAARGLPKEWSQPNAENKTGHSEKELVVMFNAGRPGNNLLKMKILPMTTSALWDVVKDGFGNITERQCLQLIGCFVEIDGECSYRTFQIREKYLGGGQYDNKNAWMQHVFKVVNIDCNIIPKSATSVSK